MLPSRAPIQRNSTITASPAVVSETLQASRVAGGSQIMPTAAAPPAPHTPVDPALDDLTRAALTRHEPNVVYFIVYESRK